MINKFDAVAMHAAMDAQRVQRGLSWRQCAESIWAQSEVLNQRRQDHPIAVSTLTGIAERGDCTCQHALFILRWLERAPEEFLVMPLTFHSDTHLPGARNDQRPRWDLSALYVALNERRSEQELTWQALAKTLRCTEHQLKGIRTVRFAIGMSLAMRIVQWLNMPAATFIYAASW